MTFLNNTFVRALFLIFIGIGCFALTRYYGDSQVKAALLSTGAMLTGVAAGNLQPKKGSDDSDDPQPSSTATTTTTSVVPK